MRFVQIVKESLDNLLNNFIPEKTKKATKTKPKRDSCVNLCKFDAIERGAFFVLFPNKYFFSLHLLTLLLPFLSD